MQDLRGRMLHHKRNIGPLTYHRVWFAAASRPFDWAKFISFRQYLGQGKPFACFAKTFHTLHINLLASPTELLAGMKKNTVYEIKRAEAKDAVHSGDTSDLQAFLTFFNVFAPTKSLSPLNLKNLLSMQDNLRLRQVFGTSEAGVPLVLAMHAYLADPDTSRVRLLYSAISVQTEDRALLGRANRYLHWSDLLAFKAEGFKLCDLGGLAMDESDPVTQGIDQFKLSFGGQVVQEDHYDSLLLVLAQKLLGKGD